MARALDLAFFKCLFVIFFLVCIEGLSSEGDIGSPFHYGPLSDFDSQGVQVTGHQGQLERHKRQVSSSPTPVSASTAGPSTTPTQKTTQTPAPTQTPIPASPSKTGGSIQTSTPILTTSTSTPSPTTSTPQLTPPKLTSTPQSTQPPKPTSTSTEAPKSTDPVIVEHDRKYYIIKTIPSRYADLWEDLNTQASVHNTLSEGHRLAQTVKLKFGFSFYGHIVTNVTIATGGFLYMSPFLHKFLTATQYIAPLMANFDTSLGNESNVRYRSTSDIFIVQWENVHLKDQVEYGTFNFQVQLKRTGQINFVYKDVPVNVSMIMEEKHPVKVGLSDAFYMDKDDKKLGMKRRTIFEYHRVIVNTTQITSKTVVILEPKPTCNMASTCDSCLSLDKKLLCSWCGIVQRCSDGVDWHRQHWLNQGCKYLSGRENCSAIPNVSPTLPGKKIGENCTGMNCTDDQHVTPKMVTNTGVNSTYQDKHIAPTRKGKAGNTNGFPPGAVIAIILIVALVVGIGGWFFYAYRNPTSASGIWLMEHRPTAMKTKLAKMKFWKQSTPSGDKYAVESQA